MSSKIILIGGGEFDNSNKTSLLFDLFGKSNLKHITIVMEPASDVEQDINKHKKRFKEILHIEPQFVHPKRKTTQSDLEKIKKADLIFFGGGQQTLIMNSLSDEFITMLHQRHKEGDVILAGTSAGAMIFSEKVIISGGNEEPQFKDKIDMISGLNIVPHTIIDTHFIERARFVRLAHMIQDNPQCLGIGIEANSAVIIEHHSLTTYGYGTITLIDGTHKRKYKKGRKKNCVFNLKVHLLVPGCSIELKRTL